ncbi:AfsR/SARP family transcriptional regulator [Micromonospora sp. NPDC003197]
MEFRLLGRMEALHDGRPVALGRRRERMLLALLLLETGSAVPPDRLADLLWDDDPPATARASLHTHVSRLRAVLTPFDVQLLSTATGYRVDVHPEQVDAHLFRTLIGRAQASSDLDERVETLRAALHLWRGPLLADLIPDRLQLRIDVELTELRLAATELLMASELDRGRHREIVGELTALVAENPLHEAYTAQLMLVLYRCGRRTEALEAYERIRGRIADELGLDPGLELQELRTAMLRDDPTLTPVTAPAAQAVLATPAPAPAASPAPAQLPLPVAHFTGRTEALRTLDSHLRDLTTAPAVAVVAITGTGGAGKTALAVTWAHRVVGQFPDGQLYIDLRGYDPGEPKSAAAALDGFLRALGVDRTPIDLDERAALYRSLLARRRMLVVLDNARSIEQIRPLLPGSPGSLVLVTSRDDLAALVARDGARRLALDRLTDTEATDLLRRILGDARVDAEPEARVELVRLCAGLPLALRIAAERAGQVIAAGKSSQVIAAKRAGQVIAGAEARTPSPSRPLAELVAELANRTRRLDVLSFPGDPLTALRVVFSWSYQALPPAAAQLFRQLGLHPGPDWDLLAAANLAGLDLDRTGRLLDLLVGAHLVEHNCHGRFQMHDLLREYAAELATVESDEALNRLYDWYLHTANVAMDLIDPHRSRARLPVLSPIVSGPAPITYDEAIDWLEAERTGLVAAILRAGDRLVHAWQLTQAIWKFFFIRGYSDDWYATGPPALAAARQLADPYAQGEILNSLGASRYATGRYDESADYYRQALPLRRQAGDRAGEAVTLGNLGVVYDLLGRYDDAVDHYLRALPIQRAIGDQRGEAMMLGNLGISLKNLGRYGDAAEHYRQAMALYRQTGDQRGEAVSLDNAAVLEDRLGNHAEALSLLREARAIAERHNDRRILSYVLNHFGAAQLSLGEVESAREAHERALMLAREIGNREAESTALKGLGTVHSRLGAHATAIELHHAALELVRRLNAPSREAEIHNDLGEAHRTAEDGTSALGPYQAALAMAVRCGDRFQQGRATFGIAQVLRTFGDHEGAHRHGTQAMKIFSGLGVPETTAVAAFLH